MSKHSKRNIFLLFLMALLSVVVSFALAARGAKFSAANGIRLNDRHDDDDHRHDWGCDPDLMVRDGAEVEISHQYALGGTTLTQYENCDIEFESAIETSQQDRYSHMLTLVLEHGLLDTDNINDFHFVMADGHDEGVAMRLAIMANMPELAKKCLDLGANPLGLIRGLPYVVHSAMKGLPDMTLSLIQDERIPRDSKGVAIVVAYQQGHLDLVRRMLQQDPVLANEKPEAQINSPASHFVDNLSFMQEVARDGLVDFSRSPDALLVALRMGYDAQADWLIDQGAARRCLPEALREVRPGSALEEKLKTAEVSIGPDAIAEGSMRTALPYRSIAALPVVDDASLNHTRTM